MRNVIEHSRGRAVTPRTAQAGLQRPVRLRSAFAAVPPSPSMTGTTLAEVLVSILIMSIGIVTLMTLFPIAILRSVQATQLTSATILRFNAETIVRTLPSLVHDPDNDGDYREHYRAAQRRNYIVDPLGYYLVDPTLQTVFGNDGATTPSSMGNILRFHGGTLTESHAADLVTLPDSWVLQVEEIPTTINTLTQLTMPSNVDLSSVAYTGGVVSRVLLFDTTGRFSQIRTITGIDVANRTVTWNGDLPDTYWNDKNNDNAYIPADDDCYVGQVRIETLERRYTWLLSVRKRSDGERAGVDIVVFFRRSFSAEDERIYAAQSTFGGTPQRTSAFLQGSDLVYLDYPSGTQPHLKKGGFIFDAVNGYWYRIRDIDDDPPIVSPATGTAKVGLQIHRPAFAGSNSAILMFGVVEVFPIGLISRN